MAKKIGNTKTAPLDDAAAERAAEELDTLHPERTVTFAWGKLFAREYGGVEWMQLRALARPIVDALAGLLAAGIPPRYESALDVLADNMGAVVQLVAISYDVPVAEISALNPEELDAALLTWWGANGRFFIRRATAAVAVMRAEAQAEKNALFTGASSTQPSSPTATATPTSAATPSGS